MSFFSNVFDFEKFKLGNMWGKIKENPEQLLIGATDPASAGIWSKVTGKEYSPLVDQWGGATGDDYSKAQAAGIDTSDGKSMHQLARALAAFYTGRYAAGQMPSQGAGGQGQGQGMWGGKEQFNPQNLASVLGRFGNQQAQNQPQVSSGPTSFTVPTGGGGQSAELAQLLRRRQLAQLSPVEQMASGGVMDV